jgi:hypothetical protein
MHTDPNTCTRHRRRILARFEGTVRAETPRRGGGMFAVI